ncbi:MAG TPA: hypothetical protein VK400_19610 [Pyrinomonadaceae bacterium]|nr:hypothetical protein [Pyrinomonadaceae bacterium]
MKYSFRLITAISTFALGVAAFSAWFAFYYLPSQSVSTQQTIESLVMLPEGQVTFRFLECAGKRSVFILENQTERPIFARFQRVDYWKEYKDANIQLGLHLIDYKAPDAQSFEDASGRWDAVIPFKEIPPHTFVRYGVDLSRARGEYRVRVPYMDDAEVAQRFDHDFVFKVRENFERNFASWKEASSDVITNRCH